MKTKHSQLLKYALLLLIIASLSSITILVTLGLASPSPGFLYSLKLKLASSMLSYDFWGISWRGSKVLEGGQSYSIPYLQKALRSNTPTKRGWALLILGDILDRGMNNTRNPTLNRNQILDDLKEDIENNLFHTNTLVQKAAVTAIGRSKDALPRFKEQLVKLTREADLEVGLSAGKVLYWHKLDADAVTAIFKRYLESTNRVNRLQVLSLIKYSGNTVSYYRHALNKLCLVGTDADKYASALFLLDTYHYETNALEAMFTLALNPKGEQYLHSKAYLKSLAQENPAVRQYLQQRSEGCTNKNLRF